MKSVFNGQTGLKASAIVNIFETGQPFGEYSALAVLNDGAGISYGISQFTHRSGSLAAVVTRYLEKGGWIERELLQEELGLLRSSSPAAVRAASRDAVLKAALIAAAESAEMRASQHEIAAELYLRPAIRACEGSGFCLPLSLAVVYDSMTHGSWEMIRDRVRIAAPNAATIGFEKAWITAYVKERHKWLRGIPRLRATSYRTSFFLSQIIAGNWQLDLPVTVNGFRLLAKHIPSVPAGGTAAAAGHLSGHSSSTLVPTETPASQKRPRAFPADVRPPHDRPPVLDSIEREVAEAARYYDRFEAVIRTVLTRTDAAKSLWTTVAGTFWQAFWGIASFLMGLPHEVWLGVAVLAAVLMVIYLYRQFALGRIRALGGLYLISPGGGRLEGSAIDKDNERL